MNGPEKFIRWLSVCLLVILAGCQGTRPPAPASTVTVRDTRLSRLAEDGGKSYAEGQTHTAIKQYKKAIRRAWAIDDPVETGTLAYNLAACLISQGRFDEASDWLVESRAELLRGGRSVGNTWLLEAKIARNQGRIDDAGRAIELAKCAGIPCEHLNPPSSSCGDEECRTTIPESIPCVGKKLQTQNRLDDCGSIFQAQLLLSKARLANDLGDLILASHHLARAKEQVDEVCGGQLQGELESVAGMIALKRGQPLKAAKYFDNEAEQLRCVGTYREVPYALQMAARSYTEAGRLDLAIDRWCRSARILHGRDDQAAAWQAVKSAVQLMSGIFISPVLSDHNRWESEAVPHGIVEEVPGTTATTELEQVAIPLSGPFANDDWVNRRLQFIAREIHLALEATP